MVRRWDDNQEHGSMKLDADGEWVLWDDIRLVCEVYEAAMALREVLRETEIESDGWTSREVRMVEGALSILVRAVDKAREGE